MQRYLPTHRSIVAPWLAAPAVGALVIALVVLPLDLATLLVLGTVAATLALHSPTLALGLAILSVPAQELVALPGGLSLTQASFGLALASLTLYFLAHPERPFVAGRLFLPIALFVWTLGLAAVLSPWSQSEALRAVARWVTVPLMYVMVLQFAAQPHSRHDGGSHPAAPLPWFIVACLLGAPAIAALVGLVQWYFGLGPDSFAIGGGRVRAYGTIGQPNSFAGYMNQAWPLAVGLALSALVGMFTGAARQPALVALFGAGAAGGLLLAALLVSYSRGGWVGGVAGALALGAALLVQLPAQLRPYAHRLLLAGAAGAVALALLGGSGLIPASITGRATSLVGNLRLFDARGADITAANFAVVERMAHLQAGWNMLERHPLLGVGPGNYDVVYESAVRGAERPINVRPWYESRGHAHNYYLHIAAEAGLLGLGAYLLLVGATGYQALRAVRAARGWFWRGVAAGGAGIVAAVAAHNLFENLHVLNMGVQLGAIWALLVAAEHVNTKERGV